MSDDKTLSVSLSAEQYAVLELLAEREQRTPSEVLQEALIQYDLQWKPRNLAEAARSVQQDARAKGVDKMTMEEIDAVIAEVRREQQEKEAAGKLA